MDKKPIATVLKSLSDGRQFLIKCEGGKLPEYVVVSYPVEKTKYLVGDETMIFEANDKGHVTNFEELPGSFRGDEDYVQALENAGYEVVKCN